MTVENKEAGSAHPLVVLVTAGERETADRIAQALIRERLAACVNIVGGVRSIYRWQGQTAGDDELLLIIKTWPDRFDELRERVVAEHEYEVPEVLALPVSGGHAPYLEWVFRETRR